MESDKDLIWEVAHFAIPTTFEEVNKLVWAAYFLGRRTEKEDRERDERNANVEQPLRDIVNDVSKGVGGDGEGKS